MMVPIYCAVCAKQGGYVPEENMTFAAWLCDDCYHTHGDPFNGMVMPDEVFWARVHAEQREQHGRELTPEETVVALADPNSLESRLARDRAVLTPVPPSL